MSTWFARRVLDVAGAVASAYYARKYGALARRLGRPGVRPDDRRGFILLQIDGLAHDHLREAMDRGYMPHLRRLLTEGDLKLAPWRCGIPSCTPAVQAGLMFGNRFDVPGFRWYEKENDRSMLTRRPDQARQLRARVSEGRRGILEGGSCYVSMLDGDAELALFTLSALHMQRFFESARGMGLFLLFLLSPIRLLRLAWLIGGRYLAGLGRRLVALVRPSVLNPFDVLSPFVHAVSDAVFTEVQTFGVMLDIYRGVPAIYANYNGYDEVAHKMGPQHPASWRVLRAVDGHLRQIDRMRLSYRKREYDLYIMSDHGNSPSVPFSWRTGKRLGEYFASQIGRGVSVDERLGEETAHSAEKARYLLGEVESIEDRLSPRLQRLLGAIRRYVRRRLPGEDELVFDLERERDVVVCASGPLAHVYLNVSPRPLDLTDVVLLYPELVDALLATEEIGAVVARSGAQTVVLGKDGGSIIIGRDGSVDGPHPLSCYGDEVYVAAQLHYLAHFPHSGDLFLLGAVEPSGTVITFEHQVSTHGGFGGPQSRPFIAWPSACRLEPERLNDSRDLYPYFVENYVKNGQSRQPLKEDGQEIETEA
jgi:hypothetical protein